MARVFRTITAAIALAALVGLRGDAQPQRPPQSTPQPPGQGQPQQTQPPPQTQQSTQGQPANQQPPGATDPQQPVFRAGINFVRVDVIITDKNGNQIGDLQPSDFEVLEDNKPQKIETFKLVKLDGGRVDAAKDPPKQIRSDYDEESEAARDDDAVMRAIQQFQGRKYDYTPRNAFEERYAYYPTEVVERVRNQVSLSALKALIVHMGTLKE